MTIRITNLENGKTHAYDAKSVKGGEKFLTDGVKNFNELKKRDNAKDWAWMIELIGMEYDIDWLEVTKYDVELTA